MSPVISNGHTFSIYRTSESSLAVELFKTGLMGRRKHVLFFERYQGTLDYDFDQPERSRGEIIVEANSLMCRDEGVKPEKRKEMAETFRAAMLDAETHPRIVLRTGEMRREAHRKFDVTGELMFRGISKAIKAEVMAVPVGAQRIELDVRARFKMSDFGITPPKAMMGLVGTQDEVAIRCLLFPERKGL